MNHIISFLLLAATIVGCHAQTTADVYVQNTPSEYLNTHFVGVKLDGTTGIATVNFHGGEYATWAYVLSFESWDQSEVFTDENTIPVMFSGTGTYWIYLAEGFTTTNQDWIEIRVVASTFSGTITALYGSAPSGWYNGYPPFYVPMVTGKLPPPSQAAPVSISKILIPILVVVIVLAISIPAGVYIYRRRQAKKMMISAQGSDSSPETSTVQMNSVVV